MPRKWETEPVASKKTSGRKKGTYTQTTRVLRMLDELRGHYMGLTMDELAERFEVVTRQVRRDLEAIREAGYELETVESDAGPARVRLLDPPIHKPIQLTQSERYALFAVRRVFDVLEHTPLHEDVRRVYGKIASSLPADKRAQLDAFGERFIYLPDGGIKEYANKEDVLNELFTAVLHRKRVRYTHRSLRGTTRKGTLEPYAIVLYKHGLYVVGRPVEGDKVHVFAVERFEDAEHLQKERFEPPADFRVDAFFHGAFGIFVGGPPTRVVVEFERDVKDVVTARCWHPSQKITSSKRGGVVVSFDVAHTPQLLSWVLGWGATARVREPKWLADEVTRVAEAMARGERVPAARPPEE
jgi:predicted DNA-binding transcriptional regulator YafY